MDIRTRPWTSIAPTAERRAALPRLVRRYIGPVVNVNPEVRVHRFTAPLRRLTHRDQFGYVDPAAARRKHTSAVPGALPGGASLSTSPAATATRTPSCPAEISRNTRTSPQLACELYLNDTRYWILPHDLTGVPAS